MDLSSLQTLLFLLLSLLPMFLYCLHYTAKSSKGIPTYPILGSVIVLLRNRHRFLDWITEIQRDNSNKTSKYIRPGRLPNIVITDPVNLEHVLKTNFDHYPKGDRFQPPFKDLLGDGIFAVDGEAWKAQRNTAVFEFSTKSLRKYIMDTATVKIQTRLIPLLARASDKGNAIVDLQNVMERFAFDSVCEVAFDVDPHCLEDDYESSNSKCNEEFMHAFDEAALICFQRAFYATPAIWKMLRFLNLGSEKKLKEAVAKIHAFADHLILTRMQMKCEKKGEDLLSRFMHNLENPTKSPEFLRDIVLNFVLAGKDTTSSVLSWFFWLLSEAPAVEKKVLEEIETIRANSGGRAGDAFTFEDLRGMNYLHAALSETVRLHPPVALNQKACVKDDVLPDGTVIKKGWGLSLCSYAMGRMESIWGDDCREFRPERWFDENGEYRHESPFKFPGFNAGPRTCLGKDMAYIQMKCIVASVLERFEIDVVEREKVPETSFSMVHKMRHGLPVRVVRRTM